jgi:hypothetical protein
MSSDLLVLERVMRNKGKRVILFVPSGGDRRVVVIYLTLVLEATQVSGDRD